MNKLKTNEQLKIQMLAARIDAEIIKFDYQPFGDVFVVDLQRHLLRGLGTNLLLVIDNSLPEGEDPLGEEMVDYIHRQLEPEDVVFFIGRNGTWRTREWFTSRFISSVLLNTDDMDRIITDPNPARRFHDLIRKQVRLTQLIPFDASKPAVGSMFFGRETEVDALVSHLSDNFLVTGPRRIGKTSLALRAYHKLRGMGYTFFNRTFYISFQGATNPRHFFKRLAGEVFPQKEAHIDFDETREESLHKFWAKTRTRCGGTVLLFLDEMDDILETDRLNGRPLMKHLQWAADKKYLRFVICGFREVQALFVGNSPLELKAERLFVGPLEANTAEALLRSPLSELGIEFDRLGTIKDILEKSGCLPQLLQEYGRQLAILSGHKHIDCLTPEEVSSVEGGNGFHEIMIDHCFKILRPGELVAFLAVVEAAIKHPTRQFLLDHSFIRSMKKTVSEIHEIFTHVVETGIVSQRGSELMVSAPLMEVLLRRDYPALTALANRLLEDIK